MSNLPRRAILAAATDRRTRAFMNRYGMRLGAARFVAGETLDDCLAGLAYLNVSALVDHAAERGNFVRIDMEHSSVVDATLGIYLRLRESGRESVGCVLQAYLYRTPSDLEAVLPLAPNVRLVKGAYLE